MKTRKFLAALLALVLVVSMIPVTASAAEASGQGIVKLGYDTGTVEKTIKVVVQYKSQTLDEYEVHDSQLADQPITLSLIGTYAETYDIESVSVDTPNFSSSTVHYLHKDSYECRLSLTGNAPAIFTVTLCDPLELPSIEGDTIDPGIGIIEYRAFDHDMLKLLYTAGVEGIDENTEINGVTMRFVDSYKVDTHEQELLDFQTAGNQLDYHYYSLSNASNGKGVPENIRYIEITYTLDGADGPETLRVYSGSLRYVNKSAGGSSIYNIEANNNGTSLVAFYNENDGESTTWSLYHVAFVTTGSPYLPGNEMPADPVYGNGSQYQFVNWDHSVGGGDPFLPYEPISDDTILYAQKTSSGATGTEYHLMNPDNSLLNRVLELYNAGAETPVESIDAETVEVQINSTDGTTSTNRDYFSNRWCNGMAYYNVYAGSAPGVPGPTTNSHVAPAEAASATIFFTVDGAENSVTIKIDDAAPGSLGISLVNDHIAELIVNPAPEPPSDDDMTGGGDDPTAPGILGDGAVKVQCVTTGTGNSARHEAAAYSVLPNSDGLNDSYKFGTVVPTADGGYTFKVTIYAAKYVAQYNAENGDATHKLAENGDGEATITLIWDFDKNEWAPESASLPITFQVECGPATPGGGEDQTTITVTPADMTIYEGGKSGYDSVVGHGQEDVNESTSLPHPIFKITAPENVDVASLTFTNKSSGNTWKPILLNEGAEGEKYYRFEPQGSTRDEVRVQFIDKDGNAVLEDAFNVSETQESFAAFSIEVYQGESDSEVTASLSGGNDPYPVETGTGTLTVRAVENENATTDVQEFAVSFTTKPIEKSRPAAEKASKSAVAVEPTNGIIYTLNDTGVPIDEEESQPALLFDDIIQSDGKGEERIEKLENAADKAITESASSGMERQYEIKYLDLVDENNGNAWIKASDKINIVWPYPEGTGADTKFQVLHFKGLHRDTNNGSTVTGFDPDDIDSVVPENVTIEKTADGIRFSAEPGGFSPFVLVWEEEKGTTDPTPGGTPPPYIPPADPDDTGVSGLLNTEDHIQYLFGYPEGTFGPENKMTRAEVAQMFYNLLLDQDVAVTKTFEDIPADAWYAKAVNTLASLGVVSGIGNGNFEPERSISRAEFTSIAMKFAVGVGEGENIFSDVDKNDWFYNAVVNSIQYGWIRGYGDGTFRPNNPITRAEVTAIVNNMLGREADEGFVDEHAKELTAFSDIEKHWAYYHIAETTNSHNYTKPSSGETWTKLN